MTYGERSKWAVPHLPRPYCQKKYAKVLKVVVVGV